MVQDHIFLDTRGGFVKVVRFPYLSLLVAEGLSRTLADARRRLVKGITIGRGESLSHLLFVDGVLLFCFGVECELEVFRDVLLYKKATGMEFNEAKSTLFIYKLPEDLAFATKLLWLMIATESLWRRILIQKYISLVLFWIGLDKSGKASRMFPTNGKH